MSGVLLTRLQTKPTVLKCVLECGISALTFSTHIQSWRQTRQNRSGLPFGLNVCRPFKHCCCRKEVVCNRDRLALGYLICGDNDNGTIVVTLFEKKCSFFSLNNRRNSTEQSTAKKTIFSSCFLVSCLQDRRNL
jgi:hypothetical protein